MTQEYLRQTVVFGGEEMSLANVIKELEKITERKDLVDYYLMGLMRNQ